MGVARANFYLYPAVAAAAAATTIKRVFVSAKAAAEARWTVVSETERRTIM